MPPRKTIKNDRAEQTNPDSSPSAGKSVYIPFCTGVTEKAVQVLTGVIADQLSKDAAQINLLIAANGGFSAPAYHLYQFLRSLPVPLATHATAEVSGFGLLPFMAGHERLAVRSARFMLAVNKTYTVEDGKGAVRGLDESPVQIDPYYAAIIQDGSNLAEDELADISYRQAWKSAGWAKRNGIVTRIADLKLPKGAVIIQPSYL